MNTVSSSLISFGIAFFPVILCRQINNFFPNHTDLRVQARIISRWRMQIREIFERRLPLDSSFRRTFTVIIPNNLPLFLYMIYQLEQIPSPHGRPLLPLTHPLVAIISIIALFGSCYCYDRARSGITSLLEDQGVPPRYRWIWAPSDYNPYTT
jgi:hypothetical protein